MFYLSVYFQSIKGQTAIMSGVYTLPYLAFFALGAVSSGTLIGKTRYLMPCEYDLFPSHTVRSRTCHSREALPVQSSPCITSDLVAKF